MKKKYYLILFFSLLFLYFLTPTIPKTLDTLPARYLPVSIIKEGDFDFDEFPHLYQPEAPYCFTQINGHYYSAYPIGAPLLSLPIYFIADLLKIDFSEKNLILLEKFSASLMVSLSAIILLLSLKIITSLKNSIITTVIYSIATCSWAVSSQALWQHPAVQLLNALTIFSLFNAKKKDYFYILSGFFAAGSIFCRPTNFICFGIIFLYLILKQRKKITYFLTGAILPLFFFGYYNLNYFGSIFGGYVYADVLGTKGITSFAAWATSPLVGLSGLLFSPSRGLFIFSPILIFSFIGLKQVFSQELRDSLLKWLSIIPLVYLVPLSFFSNWWGGHSFGYRFLTDVLPFLMIPFAFSLIYLKKRFIKIIFCILCLFSIFVQILGVYFYDATWNKFPDIDKNPQRLWDWKKSEILYLIKGGKIILDEKEPQAYLIDDGIIDFSDSKDRKHLIYGWGYPEEVPAWAKGNESLIYFYLSQKKDIILKIKAKPLRENVGNIKQTIDIYLNDNFIYRDEFQISDEWKIIEVKIPQIFLEDGIQKLKFRYGYAKRPSFLDDRKLSVAFSYIEIH